MTIYGRWGGETRIVRKAVLADVKRLENRKPDAHDRRRVADGCYLVTTSVDGSHEVLQDVAYMRADGGLSEIMEAVRALA